MHVTIGSVRLTDDHPLQGATQPAMPDRPAFHVFASYRHAESYARMAGWRPDGLGRHFVDQEDRVHRFVTLAAGPEALYGLEASAITVHAMEAANDRRFMEILAWRADRARVSIVYDYGDPPRP